MVIRNGAETPEESKEWGESSGDVTHTKLKESSGSRPTEAGRKRTASGNRKGGQEKGWHEHQQQQLGYGKGWHTNTGGSRSTEAGGAWAAEGGDPHHEHMHGNVHVYGVGGHGRPDSHQAGSEVLDYYHGTRPECLASILSQGPSSGTDQAGSDQLLRW